MEHVDRVAARVSLSAVVGFFASFAFSRGSLRSTALKVAGSCAIASTSLFGAERLAYALLQSQNVIEEPSRLLLTSHAIGGAAGGSLNGLLYVRRPHVGLVVFTPIMIGVAFAEMEWENHKERRRQAVAQRNQTLQTDEHPGQNGTKDE